MDITVYDGLIKTNPYLEFLVVFFFSVVVFSVTVLLGWVLYTVVLSDFIDDVKRSSKNRKYKEYLDSLRPVVDKFRSDETLNENFKSSKYRKYMLRGYLMDNGVNDSDLDIVTDELWKFFRT